MIKKTLPLEPQNIAFEIKRHFFLEGLLNTNHKNLLIVTKKDFQEQYLEAELYISMGVS